MNISLVSDCKSLYIERLDCDLPNIMTNVALMDIYSHSKFKDIDTFAVDIESENLRMVKDHDNVIYKEIESFLMDISNNGEYRYELQFVVDNPVDWIFFTDIAFPNVQDIPVIPSYVIPYPIDLMSIYQYYNLQIDSIKHLNNAIDPKVNILDKIDERPDGCEYSSLLNAKYNSELSKYLLW